MDTNRTTPGKNISACIHLSVFSKCFIPLGNFILPLILWLANRKNPFVNEQGKQCLNFQISTTLYYVVLTFIGLFGTLIFWVSLDGFEKFDDVDNFFQLYHTTELFSFFIFIGIVILLMIALFLFETICTILAAIRAGEGRTYSYPLSIPFIKEAY
ncbi:MAG TPA: DUF4870 domain-containing protein [Flavobacteriaceae bacterium]|nr:DUF4870 domain-containing protein [Flavobacteriaceae bacterium]